MLDPYPNKEQLLSDERAMAEIRCYLRGRLDVRAMKGYLGLPSPMDLAGLAARLGSEAGGKFDARVLIARATQLLEEAEQHLAETRNRSVAHMNRATLVEIAGRLEIPDLDSLLVRNTSLDHLDSVAHPVVCRLAELDAKVFATRDDLFHMENPTQQLRIADSRTRLRRPGFGSRLGDALRWAANAPKARDKVLEAAFTDCLRCHLARELSKPPPEIEAEDGLRADGGESEEQQFASYLADFKPKRAAPEILAFYAEGTLTMSWQGPVFATPEKLAWLSLEFHSFWQKHGGQYSKLRFAEEDTTLHRTRAKAGKTGVTNRENQTFEQHARKFVKFLGARLIPEDLTSRRILFSDFARDHVGRKTPDAQANIVDFLEALYVHQAEEPVNVLARLHSKRREEYDALTGAHKRRKRAKMALHEKSLLSRGGIPRTLLAGWGFDEAGVRSCLKILRPAFSRGQKPGF